MALLKPDGMIPGYKNKKTPRQYKQKSRSDSSDIRKQRHSRPGKTAIFSGRPISAKRDGHSSWSRAAVMENGSRPEIIETLTIEAVRKGEKREEEKSAPQRQLRGRGFHREMLVGDIISSVQFPSMKKAPEVFFHTGWMHGLEQMRKIAHYRPGPALRSWKGAADSKIGLVFGEDMCWKNNCRTSSSYRL